MRNTKRLTQAFNTVCGEEPDDIQKNVSQRLKEYIEDWLGDESELPVALATRDYYVSKQKHSSEDLVEYYVSNILIEAIEGEVLNVATS